MKLLQITALALLLNIPMAHATGNKSLLRHVAELGTMMVAGAMILIKYEEAVAPRTLVSRGGLSTTHAVIAAAVLTVPLAMATDAARSALDALNI